MNIKELKQECINNITLQAEHSTNDLKFIEAEIDRLVDEITKTPYSVSEWIRVGKERGYFDYYLNK